MTCVCMLTFSQCACVYDVCVCLSGDLLSLCFLYVGVDSQEYMMQDSGAAVLLTDTPHTYVRQHRNTCMIYIDIYIYIRYIFRET
jgi:hypothetical protein